MPSWISGIDPLRREAEVEIFTYLQASLFEEIQSSPQALTDAELAMLIGAVFRFAAADLNFMSDLINGGGRFKVPCLQISGGSGEKTWLYESDDIIAYLKSELELA